MSRGREVTAVVAEEFRAVGERADGGGVAGSGGAGVRWAMRRRRQRLKQTQVEAAGALGVSLSTYQRWERGQQTPQLPAQKRIAAHFGVSLRTVDEWFYDEVDCPTCGLVGLDDHTDGGVLSGVRR